MPTVKKPANPLRVVHVQTIVTTTFGLLDDDNNVIPQQPIQAQVGTFCAESFATVFEKLIEARDAATEALVGGQFPSTVKQQD